MNKEYKFYKYENNPEGSDYCFCQRPIDSNMSLQCFLENGEILGFMSETLVYKYQEIKEIDMNEFMYDFVRPLIKANYDLKQALIDIREYFDTSRFSSQFENNGNEENVKLDILQIINKILWSDE